MFSMLLLFHFFLFLYWFTICFWVFFLNRSICNFLFLLLGTIFLSLSCFFIIISKNEIFKSIKRGLTSNKILLFQWLFSFTRLSHVFYIYIKWYFSFHSHFLWNFFNFFCYCQLLLCLIRNKVRLKLRIRKLSDIKRYWS